MKVHELLLPGGHVALVDVDDVEMMAAERRYRYFVRLRDDTGRDVEIFKTDDALEAAGKAIRGRVEGYSATVRPALPSFGAEAQAIARVSHRAFLEVKAQ